jgi:hypothetical protein
MAMEEESLRTDFDPNHRELCPDGACIGIIGADGRCAECGKTSPKKGPSANDAKAGSDTPTGSDTPIVAGSPDDTKASPDLPRGVEGDDFDPDRRELCPDGACIGVIGTDGRCAECGTTSSQGSTSGAPKASAPPNMGSDDDGGDSAETGSPDESVENSGISDDSQDIDERKLCSDGACIGVIGSNGRCKSCGTRAE